MTIEKGAAWGTSVPTPPDLVLASSDAAVAHALLAPEHRPVAPTGGDLARTLGSPQITGRTALNELPIDLMHVRLDGTELQVGCAHVVARSRWRHGGWWRGPIVLVMNGEYLGDWDVAPRGHPNDGRVETFEVDRNFGVRDRLAARKRLRSATHVPHPLITTRSVRTATWTFPSPVHVSVDGRPSGLATSMEVTVVADAATVYA